MYFWITADAAAGVVNCEVKETMKHTRKDKERVREELNLDTPPDDEFMDLLARANAAAGNPRSAGASALRTTPAQLESAVQVATAAELLRRAKVASKRTYTEVAAHLGVSRQRAEQIIKGDNLELETLVRTAAALGYELRLSLHSVADEGSSDITAVLPHAAYASDRLAITRV